MKKLKIFIASPGDVKEDRQIVIYVGEELRRTLGDIFNAEIEVVCWETHAWPDFGKDAQDVINQEIEIGEHDIFIGIMWRRFGTPTNRAESGTDEEFEKAYEYFRKYGRPKIMFYFKTTPFYTTDLDEINQFIKVVNFRKKIEDFGALYWEYDEKLEFERRVREHLTKQISQLAKLILTTRTEDEVVLGKK